MIWDTGATNSVISRAVIDACGLAPTGMTRVHGVHGSAEAETYLVNIALPNMVIFSAVRVTKGDIGGVDVLVGMDIISSGDFSVTNCDGITKFSYRTPSIEHIDYAEQAGAIRAAKEPPPNRAARRRVKRDGG
ncbi:MAG: retroviral-like aspartic protease family protein [Chloroflexi bacterium]|nr:retroviral-like aspartic protease family protein [Chloroflexota bacterium]